MSSTLFHHSGIALENTETLLKLYRDIDPSSIPTIHSSLSSLSSNGFLNYYGMQRFGTAPIPTHLIGLALLRSEWEFAVSLLMEPREGESQDVAVSRGLWKEGKRAEARKSMPRRCTAEKAVMDAYGRGNEKDHLGALSSVRLRFLATCINLY